jgi:hypothetical protein
MDIYLQIADAINEDISAILKKALSTIDPRYRYEVNGTIFTKWGLVERDIHNAVLRHLTADET